MADYYSALQFLRQSEKLKISATDTLLSKILLGTIGCVPAFDRYFILGLKEEGIKFSRFDENSLKQLFAFAVHSKDEIQEFQNKVYKKLRLYYPVMKILDMYFWQIGYDKEIEKRRNAKC